MHCRCRFRAIENCSAKKRAAMLIMCFGGRGSRLSRQILPDLSQSISTTHGVTGESKLKLKEVNSAANIYT